MYKFLLILHHAALRLGVFEEFLRINEYLHRKFGLPALKPVRVKS